MKNPFQDSLFCGIIALQLAAFSFVFGPRWGESASLTAMLNSWNRATVEAGHPFPQFPAYDENGVRQMVVTASSQENAVLFKGTCSCDESQITNWLQAARQKGQSTTLIIPLESEQEANVIKRNHWTGRILRVRLTELKRLGLLRDEGPKQLPLVANLDKNGVILGVQSL